MLDVGQKAPIFTLPDQNGSNVSLSDFLGSVMNSKILNQKILKS